MIQKMIESINVDKILNIYAFLLVLKGKVR